MSLNKVQPAENLERKGRLTEELRTKQHKRDVKWGVDRERGTRRGAAVSAGHTQPPRQSLCTNRSSRGSQFGTARVRLGHLRPTGPCGPPHLGASSPNQEEGHGGPAQEHRPAEGPCGRSPHGPGATSPPEEGEKRHWPTCKAPPPPPDTGHHLEEGHKLGGKEKQGQESRPSQDTS